MVASSKPGSVGTDKPVIFNHNELVVISSVQNHYGLVKYVHVNCVFKFIICIFVLGPDLFRLFGTSLSVLSCGI